MEKKKLFIETYGCQMNVADSEVVAAILQKRNYELTENVTGADAIFLNTCSVRDNAEIRIWRRLDYFKSLKKKNKSLIVGVLGCMAERIGDELLALTAVDLVAGPDAYRDLPFLIDKAQKGTGAINVDLSENETYDKITPVRIGEKTLSGFVILEKYLSVLSCEIYIYEPNAAIQEVMKKERVKLTPARAMLLSVLYDLVKNGEFVSEFAAEKIAYFLQRFGADEPSN